MSANSEAINLMVLIIETEYSLLVYVVAGDDVELGEPGQRQFGGDRAEDIAGSIRQIGQIAWIQADADWSVAEITQRHGNGTEIQ